MNLLAQARWAVPGAALMGVAWFASGLVAVAVAGGEGPGHPGELRFFLIEGAHAVGEVGMLAALAGLHVQQAPRYGRLGRVGFAIAFAGTAVVLLSTVLWLGFAAAGGEGNILTGLLFASGMLGWLIGLPLFGIATLRAHVLPDWCGWLLIAFMPLVLVLFFALGTTPYGYSVGGVVVGLLWLALAFGLWSRQTSPAPQQALPDSQGAAHVPLASEVREPGPERLR